MSDTSGDENIAKRDSWEMLGVSETEDICLGILPMLSDIDSDSTFNKSDDVQLEVYKNEDKTASDPINPLDESEILTFSEPPAIFINTSNVSDIVDQVYNNTVKSETICIYDSVQTQTTVITHEKETSTANVSIKSNDVTDNFKNKVSVSIQTDNSLVTVGKYIKSTIGSEQKSYHCTAKQFVKQEYPSAESTQERFVNTIEESEPELSEQSESQSSSDSDSDSATLQSTTFTCTVENTRPNVFTWTVAKSDYPNGGYLGYRYTEKKRGTLSDAESASKITCFPTDLYPSDNNKHHESENTENTENTDDNSNDLPDNLVSQSWSKSLVCLFKRKPVKIVASATVLSMLSTFAFILIDDMTALGLVRNLASI